MWNKKYFLMFSEFVFVVGPGSYTELLDLTEWKWSRKAAYLYDRIEYTQTLHHNGHFYTFGGGSNGLRSNTRIASYSPITDTWSDRGKLLTPRLGAGVIWSRDALQWWVDTPP